MSYVPQPGEVWNYAGTLVLITSEYHWGYVGIKPLVTEEHQWYHDYGGVWYNFRKPPQEFNPGYELRDGFIQKNAWTQAKFLDKE